MGQFHTTIITSRLVETVNFFEDFFDFVPVCEEQGYFLLQKDADPKIMVAVADAKQVASLGIEPTKGLILNIPVVDVLPVYEILYMEGIDIVRGVAPSVDGGRNFMVRDPNGVLICLYDAVHEPCEMEYA